MRRTQASVASLVLSPSGRAAVRLAMPASALPAPGQVLLACRPDGADPFRHTLLPVHLDAQGLTALQPAGPAWQPGDHLDLLGPIGRGFAPSASLRRWLLAALGPAPDVLLPLLDVGIQRGVSLAMWADSPLPPLPPQVEVLSDWRGALDWADYVGLALTPGWFEADGAERGPILEAARRAQQAEALTILPMPCGTGICGACATGRGRSLLHPCVDGPVIALADLLR